MKFIETTLQGAFLLELEKFEDERGYFARSWSDTEFLDRGLDARIAQCSVSFNRKKGTVRGMHFQIAPHAESKLVRCTRGGLFDVMIDLRQDSPTFKQWIGAELTPDNGMMMYLPKGFAHGFQTLADNTEIFYQISAPYVPEAARGVRWDDPTFDIEWPLPVSVINSRDGCYADFNETVFL